MFLSCFLIFKESDPHVSYKRVSPKKKTVQGKGNVNKLFTKVQKLGHFRPFRHVQNLGADHTFAHANSQPSTAHGAPPHLESFFEKNIFSKNPIF